MEGFVWSLMSTTKGGFLDGDWVTDVEVVRPGLLKGTVFRNFSGTFKYDTEYEFWNEQFVPLESDIFKLPDYPHQTKTWRRGEKVKVYARQCWGQTMEEPFLGTVYQSQVSGSVIVSVDPDNFSNPCINSVGGKTIEVYSQQLRYFSHNFNYPIAGSQSARYDRLQGGFVRARQFRKIKNSWLARLFG